MAFLKGGNFMTICSLKYDSKEKYDFSGLKRETGFIIDSNGYIHFVEAKIFNMLGYTDIELIDKMFKDFLFDSNTLSEITYIPYYSKNIELKLRHKDGHCVNVQAFLEYVHNLDMEFIQVYGTLIEINKPQYFEAEFCTISKIVDNSKDVLYRYSAVKKRLVYISRSVFQLLGYMSEEILDDNLILLNNVHPEDLKKFHRKPGRSFDYSKPIVTRIRHSDGHYIWVEDCATPYFGDDGTLLYIDGACRDITEKVEFEKRLKYLTFHDALTGLYNRNYFEEEFNKLNNELDVPIAIILCDLDNLKIVNDSLGHDNGDQMIIHVGKLLSSLIDKNSFAARIGGDEFVIIVKENTLFDFKQLIATLVKEIDEYNKCLVDYTINMSIGSAYNDHSLNNMQRLFKLSDNQMYLNKSIRKAL